MNSDVFILKINYLSMNTTIETKRLILRPVTLDDTQDFFELDSNPEVHRYLGNHPITTLEQAKANIQYILNQYKTNGIGRLAMVHKTTNECIGWSGLKLEDVLRPEFKYYDLGYRLKEKHWRKGFATEAALASLDYGFKTLEIKEICAAAAIDNVGSNVILKQIGMQASGRFTYEGTLCNWYVLKKIDYSK